MSTITVAQALATSANGLLVADTAANIANNLSNPSLVSRVTQFYMNGNDAVAAWQAAALAAIGNKFSLNSYSLTVRDTVAQLTAAGNAAGLTISGILVAVNDTAIDIVNAYNNPIIRNANSVVLTANATLTLTQLLMLESLSNFSAAGLTLTLSDSAANLLAFTPAEAKPALTVFEVGINSTVTAAQAVTLSGMSHFAVVNSITLTISDTLNDLATDATQLHNLLALSGVAVNAADTLSNLLTLGSTFQWSAYPHVSVTLSNGGTIMVSQASTLAALPNFAVKSGQSLIIADTVVHLVTLTPSQAAIATEITLSGNDTASVAQLAILAALPNFVPSHALTVDDALAALATLTNPEHALVSAETIDDTVTNLRAAQPTALSGASAIVAELDGNTLDAAQAVALAALSAHATLTLHANGTASTLTINDTSAALSSAAASIAILEADGPVTVDTITSIDRTILTAGAAAALVGSGGIPPSYALAVADTGSALSAVASQIFGQGFEAITVTSGTFAGTMAQLLDPTLHFASGSTAQLNANAGSNVAQALELAALPGFSRATNVTLEVTDSVTDILAAAAALPAVATSILANDAESVSAAAAATLATLSGFSLNGNHLLLDDTASNLAAATAGAITLATSVNLTSDARISEATALIFVAMGSKFSPNGFFVTIADTAANLETLAGSTPDLATVNGWNGEAVLTANATVSVANATALSQLTGFNVGIYHLTLSDSADDLLDAGGSVLALAYAVQISQASTVTAANAATLEALPRFSANNLLTISDTPAALAAMAASLATPASLVSLATEITGNGGNAAGYAINATQFAALLALPHFSLAGFTGTVAVTDTDTSLLALASGLNSLSLSVLSHVTMTLGTPATVTVATAEALHALPGFSVGGSALTISDTATALTTLDADTASLASTIEVSTPATVSVATATALAALHNFTTDTNPIAIVDTAANLATLGAAQLAIASTIGLQDSALTSVANFLAISALPRYSNNGNVLVIFDTEADLLGLVHSNVTLASVIMLSTTATNLSAATAEELAMLPNFTTGTAHLTVLDSAADLLLATGNGSQPDDWTGELAASAVTLSGSGTVFVTAEQAAQLALLGGRFSAGSNILTVRDSAADLLTSAYADGLALAGAVTLSGDETALSAASATQLAAIAHFNKGSNHVTVSDLAANLAFGGYASGLALADHIQLSQAASMTVAAAEVLIGMQTFQVNADAAITITDTLPDLLSLTTAALAHNGGVLAATPIALSENAIATAAQIGALATLPQYGTFSTNSHTLTVADSGEDLASLTPEETAAAGSIVMIGDAVLTATQADALAALSVNLDGYRLIVSDTAAALLSLSNTAGLGIATTITLSNGTIVDAADATSLFTNARFSTGGQTLTISDTASALLALGSIPGQAATTLQLSESGDVVFVPQLVQLAELGSRFSLNHQTLTVSDTATELATLNSLETALVSGAVLDQDASINATTATALAALPDFTLGNDVTLTVQGSYADLEALPGSITSIATLELTGGSQTLTAAQAAVLARLSNFLPVGITVQDTIGDLNAGANAGWQTIANAGYIVTDSASNLLDDAGSPLLTNARTVTLLVDAQVDAADFATLAGMTNFSRGTAALTVEDGPVAIANNATEIALLASNALIDSSAPVSATQAEALANLNDAHKLSFTGGVSLAVQDSFTALTSASNAAGLALATTVTVLGAGADLIAAIANDWGTIQPYYELNTNSDVTAQQVATLQGLGGHYLSGGFTLTVQDNAADVVSNAAAIQALGLLVQVSDSVSDVAAEVTQLGLLGSTLQSITLTDLSSVSAGTVAALVPLVAKLVAPAITVSDTAASVDANLPVLETLGTHVSSITVSDSAAQVAGYASALSALGTELHINLSDEAPVTVAANIAAGLVPVDARLGGTTINVSDLAAQVVTYAAALAELGTVLGTVTLSDGTAINAATAAALAQIDGHLGNSVTFSVADSAEAIAGAAAGLTTMDHADRLSSIVADNDTVADVLTYGAGLASLGATATIHDSAAHVSANLDALELLSGNGGVVTGITLSDSGTPDIGLTLLQITADANVLGLISSGFKYAIADTSALIAADLGAGGSSHILTLGSAVDTITVSDSDTLTLTAATLLATGVDGGVNSALTRLANGTSVAVTGATIADFADFAALAVAPTSFAVADTGDLIGQDLESNSSVLLANRTSITGITPSSTITLDYATASEAHVNDGAGSVFSKMPGATLDVTGVPVTNVVGLFTTGVHASSITVTDSAGDIAGDLDGASPTLLTYISQISLITVSPSGTITLDADHALANGVDAGAGSVFGKMSGGTLAVTGALVGQLDALHALHQAPASVAVSDSASNIEDDLMDGATSLLETYAADGMVTAIATTGGPVILDDAYIVPAISAALERLSADSLQVTDVPVANIVTTSDLGAFASMTVSDNAASIQGDLVSDGAHLLETDHAKITSIAVSSGVVTLDYADASAAPYAFALLSSGSLSVTAVPVTGIASLAAITALSGMNVADSAAAIATDLRLGAESSEIDLNAAKITGVTVTGSNAAAADAAELSSLASKLNGPAITVSDTAAAVDTNLAGLEALGTHLGSVTVSDSAAQVEAVAAAISALGSKLHIALTDETPISVSADVAAGLVPVDTNLGSSVINVSDTGAAIAAAATTLAQLGAVLGAVTVSDGTTLSAATAAGLVPVVSYLAHDALDVIDTAALIDTYRVELETLKTDGVLQHVTASSDTAAHIVAHGAALTALAATATINDSGAGVLADLDQLQTLVTASVVTGISLNDGSTPTLTITVTQLTNDGGVLALIGSAAHLVINDTGGEVQGDLQLGGDSLIAASDGVITGITLTSGSVTLSDVQADAVATTALNLLPLDSLTVTGVPVSDVATIAGLTALSGMTVLDDSGTIHDELVLDGASSPLEVDASKITGIAFSSGPSTISLSDTQAQPVLDALAKLPNGSLSVTNVSLADVAAIAGLAPVLSGMTVSADSGAVLTSLEDGASSVLETHASKITAISFSSGASQITLPDADVGAVVGALALLPADSLVVAGVSVANIASHADLSSLAYLTVSDGASQIQGDLISGSPSLNAAEHSGLVTSIVVNDAGTITLTETQAAAAYTAGVLANLSLDGGSLIVVGVPVGEIVTVLGYPNVTGIAVFDTGEAIQGNLATGTTIASNIAAIVHITDNDDYAISLTASQIQVAGVDAAVGKLSGAPVIVTGVQVADIDTIATLAHLPTSMTVSDTALDVQNDLTEVGAASNIRASVGVISHIDLTDAGTPTIALSMANLTLNSAELSLISTTPYDLAISDTSTNIENDLNNVTTSGSFLLHHLAALFAITVSDTGATIVLTAAAAVTVGIDDGPGSVFAKMTGYGHLEVDGVAATAIDTVLDLYTTPTHITVSDTAADIAADLNLGAGSSQILGHPGTIDSITASDGLPVRITAATAELATVADNAATSVMAKLAGHNFVVTDAMVTDVFTLIDLTMAPSSIDISDSAGDIQTDLTGAGVLVSQHAIIGTITVSGGTITLTVAELVAAGVDDGAGSVFAKLSGLDHLAVTGVAVDQITSVTTGLSVVPDQIQVLDSTASLQSDLIGGTYILPNISHISEISLNDAGPIVLTAAQATTAAAAVAVLDHATLDITGVAVADVAATAGLNALASMTVSDSTVHIHDDLAAAGASMSKLVNGAGRISSITVNDAGVVSLTGAQAQAALAALAEMTAGTLTVTGVAVSHVNAIFGLAAVTAGTGMTVSDTAGDIQGDLVPSGSSKLLADLAKITSITVSDSNYVTLASADAAAVATVLAKLEAGTLEVTGVAVTDVPAVAGYTALHSMTVSDTALDVQNDLIEVGAASNLRAHVGLISGIELTDAGTPTIALSMANLTLNSTELSLISTTPYYLAISDTSTNIENDLNNVTTNGSFLLDHLAALSAITVSDTGATIILTAAAALTTGIDDGPDSVLAKVNGYGHLEVDGVAATAIDNVLGLYTTPTHITVTDNAADIAVDLNSGAGSSEILGHLGTIDSITASDGLPVGITVTTAELASVADNAVTSVMAKLVGHNFVVTDAMVTDVSTLIDLAVAPTAIDISDSAGDIQTDLTGAGVLVSQHAIIGAITVSGGTITLTVAELTAAGVDDGAGSVFAKISGLDHLAVSGVAVDQIASVTTGLSVVPDQIQVLDSTESLQSDLISGTYILPNIDDISEISLTDAGPIVLTAAQAATAAAAVAVLDHATLDITGVAVADVAATAALNALASMTVSDSTVHIHDDLAAAGASMSKLVNGAGRISSITVNDAGVVSLTGAQAQAALAALAEMTAGTLTVTGVAVSHVNAIFGLAAVTAGTGMTVSDTAGDIQGDLVPSGSSKLLADLAKITSITVSDSNYVTLASADAAAVATVLAKLEAGTLEVTGVAVTDVPAVAGYTALHSMMVSDTAEDLGDDLALGGASKLLTSSGLIGTISLTDAGPVSLTDAQAELVLVALAKLGAGTLTVTGVTAADVATIAGLAAVSTTTGMTVSDTATNLHNNLVNGLTSTLQVNAAKIAGISVSSGGPVSLTDTEAELVLAALAKLGVGTLTVTGVSQGDVATIAGLAAVTVGTGMTVSDTTANLQSNLDNGVSSTLQVNAAKITSISVSSGGPISLTGTQALAVEAALARLGASSVTLSDVAATNIATLAALSPVGSMTVTDSASAIATDLGLGGSSTILTNHSKITSVTLTDGTIDAVTAATIYSALHAASPSIPFVESALTISDTAANLLTVQGTTSAVLAAAQHVTLDANATGVSALTAANATILAGVLTTGGRGGFSVAIVDTAGAILDSVDHAAGLALATSVTLNAPAFINASNATLLANVANFDRAGPAITIQDTPTNLLTLANAAGLGIATTVMLDQSYALATTTIASLAALAGFAVDGTHAITAQDSVADILGLTAPQLGFVSSFIISDSAATVYAHLDALQTTITSRGDPQTIVLTDSSTHLAITVTAATYTTDAATLDGISVHNAVRVTGDAADIAGLASQLASDAVVGEVVVTDTSTNILGNLTALQSIGSKLDSVNITDSPLSASALSSLLTIPGLSATSVTISDTGSQIAAAIQANGGATGAGATFLNSPGVTVELSASSVISASDALTLQAVPGLNKMSYLLEVWDTPSHLTSLTYLSAVSSAPVDAVYLKTVGGTATITATVAQTLLNIPNFNSGNPLGVGGTNVLTVQDTAAHIDSTYNTLLMHGALVTQIIVSSSATITDSVLADLQSLHAIKGSGVTITVRDLASTIIGSSASQLTGGRSITPDVWALSASATNLAATDIAYLGGLAGFSAGSFTLTLGATTNVSVTNANILGGMASFRLGGHQIQVTGPVSQLIGLTTGQAIASPIIDDSFADIATLSLTSGFLAGVTKANVTINIGDIASPTALQVSEFLALLQVGGTGAGIPVANVTFPGVEAVTDTLSNLQSFTSTAVWTSNAGVQSHFTLVAADTVANLINPLNTTALSALHGTTLSSNQTPSAHDAETLAVLQSTINFTLGATYALTIVDTAANLLNPVYSDGVTLASGLELQGPDTVTATGAETLLPSSKFILNQTLTIADISSNLLDGVLGPLVGGLPLGEQSFIHVELAGPETLDAGTAQSLVGLPTFTNNGDLSIQDGSSYLLDPANLTAENDAIMVTLAGDETVSAATAASLAGLPHFILGTNHLTLASNDFANALELNALGSLGANFSSGGNSLTMTQNASIDGLTVNTVGALGSAFHLNGHTVTLTQDALALTPSEYLAVQNDGLTLNSHVLSAMPTSVGITNGSGNIHIAGTGVNGATVTLYDHTGAPVTTQTAAPGFTISAADGGANFAVTETVSGVESAPVIALEQTILTSTATSDSAAFLTTGQIQVAANEFVNLYTTATAPVSPVNPDLVYDPTAHTLSFEVGSQSPVVLLTLGTATHPAALDPSEIFVKHFA